MTLLVGDKQSAFGEEKVLQQVTQADCSVA